MEEGRREEIRTLLGGPAYSKLFAAARRRLEEAGDGAARSVTLSGLDDRERDALADLFGSARRPGETFRVRLDQLDEALRGTRVAAGLEEIIEALGGPIEDRKARRRSERDAREAMWARAASHPAVVTRPALKGWLEDLRGKGILKRLAGEEEEDLLSTALEVISRLPARGTALSVLAAETTGDAHALDVGRPLGAIVFRAAARLAGRPSPPSMAAERRSLWEEMGIVCDPLSPHALVLGIRAEEEGVLARHLREAADAGEPVKLTLRQLSRSTVTAPGETVVHVCENPSVMAVAADRLGARCPPLVCTEGVPSTAAVRLLEGLRASIRFHGDFDWGGIRIMNDLHARLGAAPWRFGVADYRAALARGLGASELGPRPAKALWDEALEPAMCAAGRAVFEEQLVEELVSDLVG